MNLMVDNFPYLSNVHKPLLERIEELRKSIIHHGVKRLCNSNIEKRRKLAKLIQEFDKNND